MVQRTLHFASLVILLPFLVFAAFTVACSAQQTEEQALRSLRDLTRDGKLPPEDVVARIENQFAGKRTGALARLLQARIRFDANDFNGAAALLNSDVFDEKTEVGDHALWLRGRALQNAGNHLEAMNVFERLVRQYPTSIRIRDARLLWANSAVAVNQGARVHDMLVELHSKNDPDALLATAKGFGSAGNTAEAANYYRRTYFHGTGTPAAKEAELKLTSMGITLTPQTADEAAARARDLVDAKKYSEAAAAYSDLFTRFPTAGNPRLQVERISALANAGRASEAQAAFNTLPVAAPEREEGYRHLVIGYAKSRQWPQVRSTIDEMRQRYPQSQSIAKTIVEAGLIARDLKSRVDEMSLLRMAVANYPNAIEVAQAQFELAWAEHENKNYDQSSRMLTEHLARYVDKDNTNRGKAGYWAARDSERAGKLNEACALYEAVNYRYGANWYGYLAAGRLSALKGRCPAEPSFGTGSIVPRAVANLKSVSVAPETATDRELERSEKSEELSTIGLFDWAIDELVEAKKTADRSPKINLALAKHYRMKGDNVNALLSLAKSYPDYSQMFPEEMGREEWDIFYPLINWTDIKHWAAQRRLDPYQVAGLIRQESVFNPRAKSHANAYGLMQLLIPTARTTARKYGSALGSIDAYTLFQPAANIELGTAYMRDQLDKFGRIEYMAVAYNAGPGRVGPWRATLPLEIDEFVEEIPFRETRGYVQGIIRNAAQYRRLYDENGQFRSNVGTRPLRTEIDSRSRDRLAVEYPDVVLTGPGGAE